MDKNLSVLPFEGIATEDTLDTREMNEYTWVFDEQTIWYNFVVDIPVGIEE